MEIYLHGEQRSAGGGVGWGVGGSGAQGAYLGGSEGADMSFEFCLF